MLSELSMLNEIRRRPEEILGDVSCSRMFAFLCGWRYGIVRYSDITTGVEYFDEKKFDETLFAKYNLPYTVFNSYSLVRLICANDREAYYLYFKELDVFLEEDSDGRRSIRVSVPESTILRSVVELLGYIRKKPPLYLGIKSVTLLRALLDGDSYAFKQSRPDEKMTPDWDEFEAWVMNEEGIRIRCRWERLALMQNFHDEGQAFDRFFEWFDLWMAQGESKRPIFERRAVD